MGWWACALCLSNSLGRRQTATPAPAVVQLLTWVLELEISATSAAYAEQAQHIRLMLSWTSMTLLEQDLFYRLVPLHPLPKREEPSTTQVWLRDYLNFLIFFSFLSCAATKTHFGQPFTIIQNTVSLPSTKRHHQTFKPHISQACYSIDSLLLYCLHNSWYQGHKLSITFVVLDQVIFDRFKVQ